MSLMDAILKKKVITVDLPNNAVLGFTGKNRKKMAEIHIPDKHTKDGMLPESFLVPASRVHKNMFGEGVRVTLPADGKTELERPIRVATYPDGRQKWKSTFRTVSNTELETMVRKAEKGEKPSALGMLNRVKQTVKTPAAQKTERKIAEPSR